MDGWMDERHSSEVPSEYMSRSQHESSNKPHQIEKKLINSIFYHHDRIKLDINNRRKLENE